MVSEVGVPRAGDPGAGLRAALDRLEAARSAVREARRAPGSGARLDLLEAEVRLARAAVRRALAAWMG